MLIFTDINVTKIYILVLYHYKVSDSLEFRVKLKLKQAVKEFIIKLFVRKVTQYHKVDFLDINISE